MKITEQLYGKLEGETVTSFLLKNDNGMEVTCINYGCIITEINVPDKSGTVENVVLGFDSLDEYITSSPFFGSAVGRVAGRIAGAQFELDGNTYHLLKNDGENNLHGGDNGNAGFDKVVWKASTEEGPEEVKVTFTHESPDGAAGFPGNLKVKITYSLNNKNELVISYYATTDKKTLVNLTNHSYFNLSGNVKNDILSHELTLKSDQFVQLGDGAIPTGKLLDVANTPFDFREGKQFKDGVDSEHPQITLVGGGYDHPFILSENHNEEICLVDNESGRKLIVETDEPAVVLYTSNWMSDDLNMRGVTSKKHIGVCLETQHHPDAVHHEHFPTIVLNKDEEYRTETVFRFLVE
ncbi:aldose epimerase family protein [Evansella cellulosilytica]|uniref:Aldose 1-epimerase n=1 Tax=Evansella cellulosilytica (strain ATCC 21833 / DSM 2522 / FERM P-1141 / JCM 9156 / N-4) TaxID=649639 RepID=E6TXM1_EVAC2|nr:aldose epimerase family protein [Evansella cellulosilytica]ADU28835.1 Aldose 1-epimerase [Evansella cellulosilytica DSM 2522]